MKTIKSIALALVLLVGTTVTAAKLPKIEKTLTTSEEIGVLLKNPEFLVENEIKANVKFMVNDQNELVVVSVSTNQAHLENFVKRRLNYKTLKSTLDQERVYDIVVRLVSND